MKKFYILLLSIFSEYLTGEYQLLIHKFFNGEIIYDIDLINQNNKDNNNFHYYGLIENIENIANIDFINDETINDIMKGKQNILLYILNKNNIHYINFFPNSTIFIIGDDLLDYLEDGYQNYNIFSINHKKEYLEKILINKKYYYVKIGKKLDDILKNFLFILLFFSLFICIIISIIMTKIIKNLAGEHQLAIYSLMCVSSYLLFVSNLINGVFFIFFKNQEYCFIMEYTTILIYSFYKSNIFSILLLILLGWGTIFFNWTQKFRKLNKLIFAIDLILSILIILSVYFIHSINKLNLLYTKNSLEYLIIFFINLYSIFKRLIPLSNQLKYEEKYNSNLANICKYKYNKLFLINIIVISYTIFFLITPFLDYKFFNFYANNYNIHFIFQLFYETIFIIFFFVGFFPQKLPEIYYDDVIFKYKSQVFFRANIYEEEIYNESINESNDINYSKEFNISNLTADKLKKISKKKNPIILINPFISAKNKKLYNEIHFGIVGKSLK